MVDATRGASNLSEILNTIDLGPTGSVQMMFAKLQLAQAEICKAQAEDYMKQIETIQEEQEKCAKMIEEARNCQQKSKDDEGTGSKSITGKTVGDGCFAMSQELIDYMDKYGLSYPNDDKDYILGTDEWDYALKSLTNYQETIGNKTQTLMVYLQDFIGQYNSYLQGANTQIANANQTLTSLARGQ